MIRPEVVWGGARAEMRQCRRLVRFWVFEGIAAAVALSVYIYYMSVHWNLSASSASAAIFNPRFLLRFLGIYYLYFGFFFGLVFLGFDLRARDNRERMEEVVDSLPCSNLEWLLGRFFGILIPAWIPLVFISIALLIIGLPYEESLEPTSLLTFLVPMALPGSAFVLGLTFLVTLLVRNRMVAASLLVAFLVALIVANFSVVPLALLPLTDLSGGFMVPDTSDIIPRFIDSRALSQRSGYLLAGLAFVLLSAAVYPRRDDTPRWRTSLAALMLLAGAWTLCGGQVSHTRQALTLREAWRSAHAASSVEAVPDMLRLAGRVSVDPGRTIDADLTLTLGPADGETVRQALFTLNPGLKVISVAEAGGRPLAFTHRDGLLQIALEDPVSGTDEVSLSVKLSGVPDKAFAYLDSAFEPLTRSVRDSQILLLGHEPYLFEPRFVALMPGVAWLPRPGPAVGGGKWRAGSDFYQVDLEVDLPEGWLAAGPGRRRTLQGGPGRAHFRFAPEAPVPDVALVAGHFASASTEVDGVTLEALVHPSHARVLDFFEDAAPEIRAWIEGRLREASKMGLDYPYDALTLVEVPSSLRGYAGGWRMASALAQPAMILTREAGFPTARFDTRFRETAKFEERPGGVPRAKRDALIRFFMNDFSGGNPFTAAAKNFFGFQTEAAGGDALPLGFVCETLAARLVTERADYFSVFHLGSELNRSVAGWLGDSSDPTADRIDLARAVIDMVTSRSWVWDAVLENRLSDLDPWKDPSSALDVLTLKGGAMADSLLDTLGREKAGRLLGEIRRRHEGGTFGRDDLIAIGRELGTDLEETLSVWLDESRLPGFTLGNVGAWRLPDKGGSPAYQIEVTVRNDEPTAGLARLEYAIPGSAGPAVDRTEPIAIPGRGALKIGVVTAAPPESVRVVPYLALNRAPFTVPLPSFNERRVQRREPFRGWRPVEYEPGTGEALVVDDLDPGFGVTRPDEGSAWRVRGRTRAADWDGGLPVLAAGAPASEWSRTASPDAYGKYRHTMAVVLPGSAGQTATFTATIPHPGPWDLEYHLPPAGVSRTDARRGTWHMAVVNGSSEKPVSFDADGAEAGWNKIASLDLAAGAVEVRVHDRSDGGLVVADAIRWTPAARSAEKVAE